ncbi:SCL-interrupting locus protein like protein [Habropoda laboriosa]|uniref:SCL-interrupting locus protein like protein n=1 Tax=Habropoda laboriosa TaxID=597456 RepID=A0A0L7QPY5_9HYME|nr:SCL-interrupting locus protein like protein [Habropoda laboriosa]
MHHFCNDEDEFEPRITPKPASKLNRFTVPSVPEVSLIFDKPLSCKTIEHTDFQSAPVASKSLMLKNKISSPLNINASYAAWKEQNYSWNPPTSKINDYTIPQKAQSNQNYMVHSYLAEDNTTDALNRSKGKNYTLKKDSHNASRNEFQLPHYVGQQNRYFNMNAYPFPQLQPYSTQNTDNQETVKNLLQIINSQNEQIKSLQTQVDRLLKIQEENLKERKRCSCSFQLQQQSDQLHTDSNDIVNASNYVTISENTKKTAYQSDPFKDKRKENCNENENLNQEELILTDGQSKKTFMEQKVSIGVMTSFEFTVQNSPFTVDIEDYEKKDSQHKQENLKMCNNIGFQDTNESLRRYKNSFTRMPSAQLENIVEDSESYISSSQQQSSNLNASTSIKDLEKQAYMDIRRETDTHRSRSPKLCKRVATKLNETEGNTKQHLERTCTEEIRNYETVKTPIVQRNTVNTEYNALENKNYKINPVPNTNQYKKSNIQRDNVKGTNSVDNSDYYKDYRKERKISKQNNCIEDSLILNGGDLKINERPPPTPEPSIHVEMHEYSSDDDSEKVKRSSKVGWTFYNNVLGQVNQLLQNSCVIDDQQQNQTKVNQNERDETENRAVLDTVKVATLEQLKKLGISLSENPEAKELNNSNKMAFDLSFYPRLDYQANMSHATSAVNETNTSMHMKALALKYLTDEQLAELAVQRQGSTSVKHLMVSNVQGTNMSFATMRYLERYQLLPGKSNGQAEDIGKLQVDVPSKVELKFTNSKGSPKTLQRFPFSQTPRTTCPSKILDISTLKQQPKLL